ncbi:MAG: carbohydrate ABC transporter permease [Methylocystis sp.]|nr:carbohydrate ABC transporter permease [Methylocystis sp.]MCA3582994.1 carbohydrate ABC transporter permease [Methylocystis sp.]MCA3587317.1 carbohydrate ABC transporter permease [Methylocystis sp.]MCA3590399.1 carbohydrate ABC transporter permease [Methylocystis sp.]
MITTTDVSSFLTRRRSPHGWHWTDWLSYAYLAVGVLLVLLPIFWMFMSSIKSPRALVENDPRLLPYEQLTIPAADGSRQLGVFIWTKPDGSKADVAFVGPRGANARVYELANPSEIIEVPRTALARKDIIQPRFENYTDPTIGSTQSRTFNFLRYFWNSTFVTVVATLLTLVVNAMAAFALSKYKFRGRDAMVIVIVSTLLIPPTVILVPLFMTVSKLGMLNSLWGVIIPAIATPTGVFLLRQYMLTIPDELLEAARMDGASEWKIFWRIMLPLSLPALSVLAILSVMWRWNDFMWPLIVLTQSEVFTLQLGLSTFKGELNDNMHYLLAMTVLTLLPVTLVFVFLQKHITTGIANTGLK